MIDTSSADTRQGKVKIITDELEKGLKNLLQSDKYKEYLTAMSKFYHYSFNNTVLILTQKPDATMVAGLQNWNKNFHRSVNKGEKGIVILAPAPYKKTVESKIFDNDGTPKLDANGNQLAEQRVVQIQAFKPAYVYDVSQTHGEPIPQITVSELTGEVNDYDKMFNALKEIAPVDVSFEKIESGAKGYYSHIEKRIAIKKGMSELQNLKTLVHETAHAMLHDNDLLKSTGEQKDRQTKEVEAESVAYTVCSYLGLPTDEYSFGYIAGWAGERELDTVRESMETIQRCSSDIIGELEKRLIPEQAILLTAETKQQEQIRALAI